MHFGRKKLPSVTRSIRDLLVKSAIFSMIYCQKKFYIMYYIDEKADDIWKFWYSFSLTVKYLREVTPYFRKASIISEVGWELQRGFLSGAPPAVRSPQRADTRYLPLQLCHLARNFRYPDPGEWKLLTQYSWNVDLLINQPSENHKFISDLAVETDALQNEKAGFV